MVVHRNSTAVNETQSLGLDASWNETPVDGVDFVKITRRLQFHRAPEEHQAGWLGNAGDHIFERAGAVGHVVRRLESGKIGDVVEAVASQVAALVSFRTRQAGEIRFTIADEGQPVGPGQHVVES